MIYIRVEVRQPGYISARPRQAGDKPSANGIGGLPHHDRNRLVAFFGSMSRMCAPRNKDVHLKRTSSAARPGSLSNFPFRRSVLNDDVFSVHIAEFAQTLKKRLGADQV